MKKILFSFVILASTLTFSQEQFTGLTTSSRVGIINADMNPAELVNLSKKFEVTIFGLSLNVSNNKIGFSDLTSNKSFEELIFLGSDPVNMRFDAEIIGPSVAMKWKKWGFGFTTKAYGKLNVIDVDPNIGDAVTNGGLNSLIGSTILNNSNNQRLNATTWGEIGLSAGRVLYDTEKYQISAGAKLKFLFPGSYSNFGADQFKGTINNNFGNPTLTNATATLNFSYSGNLADSFSNFNDYSNSIFGQLNGAAFDFGGTFKIKDGAEKYKFKTGFSIRNIGSMKFSNTNNNSTNYTLSIQGTQSLDLTQFQNVNNLQQVETILLNSGYLTKQTSNKDFKVKLPTQITLYGDIKIVPKVYVSALLLRRVNKDNSNDQIAGVNSFSLTPRVNLGFFEAFLPYTNNEIAGSNLGLGFRLGGFYIGSGSIITALIADSKQADIYAGFRWAFL